MVHAILGEIERRAEMRLKRYKNLQYAHRKFCQGADASDPRRIIASAKIQQCAGWIAAQLRVISDVKERRRAANKQEACA